MSIPLGDVLQKIAAHVSTDLKVLIALMAKQDPELRTLELKNFIARTKRKLLQTLALLRWLSSSNVMASFSALSDFNRQLISVDGVLSRGLDELYFTHFHMYAMRSRQYCVSKAMDILASKTYPFLPASVFSCGRPDFPLHDNDGNSSSVISNDLDVFIRAKLILHDSLPHDVPQVEKLVAGGVLAIEYPHYFILHLTLCELHERARWKILGFKVLCCKDDDDAELIVLEKHLLRLLKKVSMETATAEAVDPSGPPTISSACLRRMVLLCRHAAIGAGLRELYSRMVAHLSTAYGSFEGVCRVDFVDSPHCSSYLSVKYWCSTHDGEHRFELRIHQPRQATPMGEGLQVDLLTELTASYAVTTTTTALIREVSRTRMFPVPGVSSVLKGEKYLLICAVESKGGLSAAQQLIADVLSLTVDAKLRTLQERIEFSMKATAAVDAYRFCLVSREDGANCLLLTYDPSSSGTNPSLNSISVAIRVDARSGTFVLDAVGLAVKHVLHMEKQGCELFLREINNIDSENYCSNRMLKVGMRGEVDAAEHIFANMILLIPTISTLGSVLRLLELAFWDDCVRRCLPTALACKDLLRGLMQSSSLGLDVAAGSAPLIYNIRYWRRESEIKRPSAAMMELSSYCPYSLWTSSREALLGLASSGDCSSGRGVDVGSIKVEQRSSTMMSGGSIGNKRARNNDNNDDDEVCMLYEGRPTHCSIVALHLVVHVDRGALTLGCCLSQHDVASYPSNSLLEGSKVVAVHRIEPTVRLVYGVTLGEDAALALIGDAIRRSQKWASQQLCPPTSTQDCYGWKPLHSMSSGDFKASTISTRDSFCAVGCRPSIHSRCSFDDRNVIDALYVFDIQHPSAVDSHLHIKQLLQSNATKVHMVFRISSHSDGDTSDPHYDKALSINCESFAMNHHELASIAVLTLSEEATARYYDYAMTLINSLLHDHAVRCSIHNIRSELIHILRVLCPLLRILWYIALLNDHSNDNSNTEGGGVNGSRPSFRPLYSVRPVHVSLSKDLLVERGLFSTEVINALKLTLAVDWCQCETDDGDDDDGDDESGASYEGSHYISIDVQSTNENISDGAEGPREADITIADVLPNSLCQMMKASDCSYQVISNFIDKFYRTVCMQE